MSNNIHNEEVNQLIEIIDNPEIEDQVKDLKKIDPLESLKISIFNFFKKRLDYIQDKENFAIKIQKKIEEKLQNDEIELKDLMTLLRLYLQQTSFATEHITGLFKPAPGAPSPFTEQMSQKEKEMDDYERLFNEASPEQLQTLDKFYRMINKLIKDQEG